MIVVDVVVNIKKKLKQKSMQKLPFLILLQISNVEVGEIEQLASDLGQP